MKVGSNNRPMGIFHSLIFKGCFPVMNCELVLSWVVEQPMMEVWSLMAWMIGWENFMKVTNHDPSQVR